MINVYCIVPINYLYLYRTVNQKIGALTQNSIRILPITHFKLTLETSRCSFKCTCPGLQKRYSRVVFGKLQS